MVRVQYGTSNFLCRRVKWLQLDLNPEPLSPYTVTRPFNQTGLSKTLSNSNIYPNWTSFIKFGIHSSDRTLLVLFFVDIYFMKPEKITDPRVFTSWDVWKAWLKAAVVFYCKLFPNTTRTVCNGKLKSKKHWWREFSCVRTDKVKINIAVS